jgi:hypothetical protein
MGARNRVGIGLAESIPWNRFQGPLKVYKYLLCYWKQKEQRQPQLGADKLVTTQIRKLKTLMSLFLMPFPFLHILNSLQSSLTVYILPSLSACCVTSRQHSYPPPPHTHPHTVCTHLAIIMVMYLRIYLKRI